MKPISALVLVAGVVVGALSACGGTTDSPAGSSGSSGSSGDVDAGTSGGSGDDAGADSASPFDTPTVCTSKQNWTRGDRGSSQMHPGDACIACHTTRGGA